MLMSVQCMVENASGQELVQCEYCGEWVPAGNEYRNHVAAHGENASGQERVQCEYCGERFTAGSEYRNHVMAAHGVSGE